jgi:hypothetical protein
VDLSELIASVEWGRVIAQLSPGVLTGIAIKAVFDAATERRRRRHDRQMRVFDAQLWTAAAFLSAADRVRRTTQSVDTTWRTVDGAKTGDQAAYDEARGRIAAAQGRVAEATADAEAAYNELRLLIPDAAQPARSYLDLCSQAEAHPDASRPEREAAREQVENAVRSAMGVEMPTRRPRRHRKRET